MAFIARIYCDDRIYSLDSANCNRATIGCDCFDTLKIEQCSIKKGQIVITKSSNTYTIQAKNGMCDRNGSPVSSDVIAVGNNYTVECEPPVYIAIHPKQENGKQAVKLGNSQEIYIGRGGQNHIILHNKRTSTNHCKLYRSSGLWKIRDLRSSNGTFVNGKKIYEKTLSEGDYINISVYVLTFKNNELNFYNVGEDLEINMNNIEEKRDNGTVSMFDEKAATRESTHSHSRVDSFDEQSVTRVHQTDRNGTISVFDIM